MDSAAYALPGPENLLAGPDTLTAAKWADPGFDRREHLSLVHNLVMDIVQQQWPIVHSVPRTYSRLEYISAILLEANYQADNKIVYALCDAPEFLMNHGLRRHLHGRQDARATLVNPNISLFNIPGQWHQKFSHQHQLQAALPLLSLLPRTNRKLFVSTLSVQTEVVTLQQRLAGARLGSHSK